MAIDLSSPGASEAGLRTSLLAIQQLPRGVRVACVGDSILAQNHRGDNSAPTSISNETNGELVWARLVSPNFLFHSVYDNTRGYADGRTFWGLNEAIGGELTADTLAGISRVIAKRPDVCVVGVGTNDISQVSPAVSYATIITNLLAIIEALRDANIQVILCTIPPRSTSSWAVGATRRKWNAVNSWIRNAARRIPGVYIHDRAFYLQDPASTTGGPLSGVLKSDDLHLTPTGARLSGIALGTLLGKMFPTALLKYQGGQDDVYDATDNPFGNLITNGRFVGTAGTPGAGMTGTLTTSWSCARTTGSTVTCEGSKETDSVLGELQVLTFSLPGGGSGNDVFMLTAPTGASVSPAAGLFVQGGVDMKLTATAVLADSLLMIRNAVATGHSSMGFRQNDLSVLLPNAAIDGPIFTEPFEVPATPGTWTWRMEMRFPAASAGSVVLKFGNAWLRQVEDPANMWS